MASLTEFDALCADIQAGKFLPVYVFCGEEPYFTDTLTEKVLQYALTESEKAFNQSIFYGREISARHIIEAATRLPMMAQRQVVVIKEAQSLDLKKEEDQLLLTNYFKKPLQSTVLVFAFKNASPDKRKTLWKEAAKSRGFFESKKIYDDKMPQVIRKIAEQKGYSIEETAIALMIESMGNNLTVILNEIDKMTVSKAKGTSITVADVENLAGISREYSVFELNNALAYRDAEKAFRIAHFLSNSKNNPFVMTIASLYSFFSKVYVALAYKNADDTTLSSALKIKPFFLKEYKAAMANYTADHIQNILVLLNEYDLRSKGVDGTANIEESELLKEMVYRILTERKMVLVK
ncbi:MAG: DNA polymerase III subunit delta [Chitinophagales bacterium]|nr:DNA polymerase III subunit delta [Chitinophagales bacterium]